MFAGEHPGPVGVHVEVPASRVTAVEVGPRDAGPVGAVGEVFRQGGGSHGTDLAVGLRWAGSWVVGLGVVLLGQRRLKVETQGQRETGREKKDLEESFDGDISSSFLFCSILRNARCHKVAGSGVHRSQRPVRLPLPISHDGV